MDLIIRLKRPLNVDPFEALVLASKRRKKESDDDSASGENDSSPTILKFAGTLKHQEEDISPHIFKARQREDVKSVGRFSAKDVIKKARNEAKKASKENRFKILNFSRAAADVKLDHSYASSEGDSQNLRITEYTIVDVEHDCETNKSTDDKTEDDGYVYSLYYANRGGGDISDNFMESVSIEPLDVSNYPLYDYRDEDEENIPDDEDDSNDESNWRNDYPDSDYDKERQDGDDSDRSVEYMMEHLNLDPEQNLSSDDGEDILPYGLDADEVRRHGESYARFKARVMQQFGSTETSSDEDDD